MFYRGQVCAVAAAAECATWAVGQGLCTEHIAQVQRAMRRAGKDRWTTGAALLPADDFVDDYVKLYALMLDKRRCQDLIKELNDEIVRGAIQRSFDADRVQRYHEARTPSDEQYVRLSRVLEFYEGLCWFPTTHRLYTGGLTSENYQASIALGYMPKDAGAGPDHGEYSHRLQWHIIMRVVTNRFTVPFVKGVWGHSPLELFTNLGTRESMERGLWGLIFDNGTDGKRYDNPGILNQEICRQFEKSSYTGETIGDEFRGSIKALSDNASRRTAKRQLIIATAEDVRRRLKGAGRIPDKLTGGLDFDQNLVGLLERWKKLGKPPFLDTRQVSDHETNRAYNMIAREVWKRLHLKAKRGAYVQDAGEHHALVLQGEQQMTSGLINERKRQSRETLNPAYTYNEQCGAYAGNVVADPLVL